MDNNSKIMAVFLVAVIVIVAGVTVVLTGNNGGDGGNDATGRLLVYGNANNDDYLDDKDVQFIQDIVDGKSVWNRTTNPYADANNDHVVNAKDVEYLKNLIKGNDAKDTLMYYTNFYGGADYVHFPVKGDIGVNYVYGLQICQTLGIYNRITGAINGVINDYEEAFYPGLKSLKNLGTDGDSAAFLDTLISNNISTVIGFQDNNLTTLARAGTSNIDVINLPFARVGGGVDPLKAVMTSGALFGCLDEAREYAGYYDKMYNYVNSHVKDIPADKTAVMVFNPSSTTTVGIDTFGADGTQMGDSWVVFQLPLIDNADHSKSAYVSMAVDSPNITDADYIIIELGMFALGSTTSIEDGQAVFDSKCEYLKGTKAYTNGHIVGVGFVPIGTYLGISELGLLANAIWPGIFDSDEGFKLLEECYTKFAHVPENYDFKNSGYFHIYTQTPSA